jgi:hypothetical protein
LIQNEIRKNLINYDCFTDIAFSQTSKNYKTNLSFNCQARSASIYLGLLSKYSDKEIINELLKITLNNSDEITEAQLTLDF